MYHLLLRGGFEFHFEPCSSLVSTGKRNIVQLSLQDLPEHLFIESTLENRFTICSIVRIYVHEYGTIKPHFDRSSFNCADTTLLIYLNEGFEGGTLFLQEPSGTVVSFIPKTGYGILFPKSTLHWTDELYSKKIVLLMDLKTVK